MKVSKNEQIRNIEKFRTEVRGLVNRLSIDGECNTPDFILADYLVNCLQNYAEITKLRDVWHT